MRKKVFQLIFFAVIVAVGIFAIDSKLNSSPLYCDCFNTLVANAHCDSVCANHGGCQSYIYEPWDCVCIDSKCGCDTEFWCNDDTMTIWTVYSFICDCP
jgi:hypothetical protein